MILTIIYFTEYVIIVINIKKSFQLSLENNFNTNN